MLFSLVCRFKNKVALGLYLSYVFKVVGMYEGDVLTVLKDLDKQSINCAVCLLTQRTEAMYLLPVLKERDLQQASPAPSISTTSAQETYKTHETHQTDETYENIKPMKV